MHVLEHHIYHLISIHYFHLSVKGLVTSHKILNVVPMIILEIVMGMVIVMSDDAERHVIHQYYRLIHNGGCYRERPWTRRKVGFWRTFMCISRCFIRPVMVKVI